MRRAAWAFATLALLATACAGDDHDSSVVAVTTTTTATGEPATTAGDPPSGEVEPGADSDPPTDPPTDAPTDPPTDAPTDPPTVPETSVPVEASPAPEPRVGDPRVMVVEVGRFDRPVDLKPRPGDAALYVVQQRGDVVRWDGDDRRTALDLTGRVSTGGEQGLLGLAFSPDGSTAYVNFTATDGTTTIAEFDVADDGTFDPDSERTVLQVAQPYANHNAGDLATDDKGQLYVPLGDGGSGGDPLRVSHDPTSLLGSLLRIDPAPSGDRPYTIPPDNPFADGPLVVDDGNRAGIAIEGAPEVFAWGLRNPWKIAIDPVTADLWIPDVGQNEIEEVNVVGPTGDRPAGWAHDFGWSAFEGDRRYNDDVPDTGRATPPVLTYRHGSDGCSVSGGAPYRGAAIPELEPAFVYSDYCSGILWALDVAGSRNLVLLDGLAGVTAIRADADGELYVLEIGGRILQLAPA